MKPFYLFFIVLFPVSLLAQSLFKGDPYVLNEKVLFNTLPEIDVFDANGQSFKLKSYISDNRKHKDKPFGIIVWGSNGSATISDKISEIEATGIGKQYNISTLYLSWKKTSDDIYIDFLKELEKREVRNKWGDFLSLSTAWDNLEKGLYINGFPYFIYTDAKLNVLAVTPRVDGSAFKKSLDYIETGKLNGSKRWYTIQGALVVENDADASYFEQVTLQNDRIDFITGNKELVLNRIQYLKNGSEYLYDGILETKNLKGEILESGTFKDGKPMTTFNTFYDGGKVKSVYPVNGIYKAYNEKAKVTIEGPIVNGLGNGIFKKYNDAGKVVERFTYKAGKLITTDK